MAVSTGTKLRRVIDSVRPHLSLARFVVTLTSSGLPHVATSKMASPGELRLFLTFCLSIGHPQATRCRDYYAAPVCVALLLQSRSLGALPWLPHAQLSDDWQELFTRFEKFRRCVSRPARLCCYRLVTPEPPSYFKCRSCSPPNAKPHGSFIFLPTGDANSNSAIGSFVGKSGHSSSVADTWRACDVGVSDSPIFSFCHASS